MIQKIQTAAEQIAPLIIRTPLVASPTFSRMFDAQVYLKLENLQKTGSFKIRGAAYKILKYQKQIGPKGVAAASAGNHAQGVALAARNVNLPSTIVMPQWASISKQEATRTYGGQVVLHGNSVAESLEKARSLAQEGQTFIHPFDDLDIITGQGTIGLEILNDLKKPDMIFVPIGGGGLISGIACAVKSLHPEVKIIGVQAAACPSAHESLRKGCITRVKAKTSIADGITVKQPGEHSFKMIQKYVDKVVLATEEDIAGAMLMLLERKKILAEGAGAIALAALLNGSVVPPKGSNVVLMVSGGNVDSPLLNRIIKKGLLKNGRVMRVCLELADIPGALSQILEIVARLKANVLHIYHNREIHDMPLYMTTVELELETRSHAHINEIRKELKQAGYLD